MIPVSRPPAAVLAIVAAWSLLNAFAARAELVMQLPPATVTAQTPVSPTSGLSCLVKTGPIDGYGYRKVRFKLAGAGPAVVASQVSVRFSARQSSDNATITAEASGELSPGATDLELTIATPQYHRWDLVWWDVYVDGFRDRSLSIDEQAPAANPATARQNKLHVLDLTESKKVRSVGSRIVMPNVPLFARYRLEPDDTWAGYSQLDAVMVDLGALEALQRETPTRFEAMLRWVSSGGSLWVVDAGKEERSRVDELLAAEELCPLLPPEREEDGLARGWRWVRLRPQKPDSATPVRLGSDGRLISALDNQPDAVAGADKASDSDKQDETDAAPLGPRLWFAEKAFGFGRVVAFLPRGAAMNLVVRDWRQRGGPASSRPASERDAFERLAERSWERRHGLTPDEPNPDFANLLVPGVGQAPVIEFQVLITLFAIVVGPLSYWLLKRRHSTHLMVVTVPVLAASLTSALLLYALLGDGFGAKARIRAVTFLDQNRGRQATHAHLSYYAAFAPSEGLVFSPQATVYPVLPDWGQLGMAGDAAAARNLAWQEGRQRLNRGWLRSRSPAQYYQVAVGPTDRRLVIGGAAASRSVTNRLGADVRLLLVVDEEGRLRQAVDLADGDERALDEAATQEALMRLRELVIDNEPYPPDGLSAKNSLPMIDDARRQARQRRSRQQRGPATVAADQSLLNRTIRDLVGFPGGGLPLPPRSYLAVTQEAVGAEIGIAGVRQTGGFHIVLGAW